MFREFREFPNPEEQDFDIKSSFSSSSEDDFDDEAYQQMLADQEENNRIHIELCDVLGGLIEDMEGDEILETYGITEEEYMHPTREVIEKARAFLENKGRKK